MAKHAYNSELRVSRLKGKHYSDGEGSIKDPYIVTMNGNFIGAWWADDWDSLSGNTIRLNPGDGPVEIEFRFAPKGYRGPI